MADHVLTLPLTEEALERLKAAARAAGLTPEAYAGAVLDRAFTEQSFGVREDQAAFETGQTELYASPPDGPTAAEALAEYDRTGVYETFEEWSTAFETDLKARLDARR
ncbi:MULTISPECIES: hypothetical protein [Brevundimonas]|jgi:hypothetical protein|uniref:hypothetical protein n=1 Tax=Brevundimonas TaxID=41275 RepID=UPI0006D0EE26|nr:MULTISPECIES: hypothetical protein [Brevundimonas]ALJ08161.1 hypothetical protein JL11_07285 [Brevundimonas sp. DS20]MBD3838165.1 hypothetical protein [Brevundimonas sp.]MCC4295612.1 hypothetical protein [Brevundimonas aurantiaca]QFU31423.1 hypothetical protein BSP_07105 [Brevundimonas sp. Bb-A]